MKKKYIVNGKVYEVPDNESAAFLKDFPDAKVQYDIEGKQYQIPHQEVDAFEIDMGLKKKAKVGSINFEESSLAAGNAQSNGVGGEEIQTIELYTTPNGETIEDPFRLSQKYNELSNATKEVSMPSSGKGGQLLTQVPDEYKRKEAKELKERLSKAGIDADEFYGEIKDIPDQVLEAAKPELLRDRAENNPLYQRKLANIKWRSEFENKLINDVDNGNITPENYNRLKEGIDKLPQFTGSGDFSNQRGAVKSLAQDIQLYGGANRDKILENFAVEVSKVYGSAYRNNFANTIKDTPEGKYLNADEQLALQYLKDVAPDKAWQYDRLMVDPATLKDNPDALKGYNHLKQTLEETGIGLQQNAVTEELNNLKSIANKYGGLTEEQLAKATELEKKQEELTQKQNELDAKYPDRIEDKVDDALQEIMGQRLGGRGNFVDRAIGFGQYFGGSAGVAFKNTAQGIWEVVSTPFMSDASNTMRELSIMGETLEDNRIYHKTDKNQALLTDKMVIEPELQTQIDAIKNNKVMTESQKEMKIYQLLRQNTDKFGRVPIKGGKWNLNGASIAYGLSDLGTTLLPFVALETLTGGGATAGLARKFMTTFTAAAATSFHDEYASALLSGKSQSEAYKEAMGMTAISSLAMAGASTPSKIKAMVNPKTSAGKLILSMSDDAIQKVLDKGGNKALNAIKGRLKATPEMVKGGLKTGAEFEVAMTAANELKHQIYDTEIDREANFKHSLLAIGNFGIMGASLGQFGYKSPTQMQKGAGLMFGAKPKDYISVAEQMRKDGQLTEAEFNHRVELINQFGDAYKSIPKDLPENKKAEYLYQTVIKNEANKGKSDLPPKQAAQAEKTALVADHTRGLILDPPTEKQLNDRKGVLERKLEPKKDAEGKSIELPEKEKLDLQAELEAVTNELETRKSFEKVEMKKREFVNTKLSEPLPDSFAGGKIDEQGVPIGEDVPPPTEQQSGKDVVVELPNYGKTVDTKMGKVDLVVEPNAESENKNSIKVSAYDVDGNTLGFSSAVINPESKTLTVKVSQIKDEFQRNGIYSKIVDEYQKIADDKGLKLERDIDGETQASKDFWNNRTKPSTPKAEVVDNTTPKGNTSNVVEGSGKGGEVEEKAFTKNALDRADAKKIFAQVREVDTPVDAEQVALEYIANGGKVSETAINEVAGTVKRASLNTGARELKSSEAKARDYSDKKAETLDQLAHNLWELNGQRIPESEIKDALMDVIRSHNTRLDAGKAYLERYSAEYNEKKLQEKFYQEHLQEIAAEEKAINEMLSKENTLAEEAMADDNYVTKLIEKYETENKGQDKQPATKTESGIDKGISSKEGDGKTKEITNEEKVTKDTNTPTVESKEQPLVIEPTPKTEEGKGKFEEKARKLAEKIMATDIVPDWLKIDDPNVKKSGADAETIKKALADATIKMGKLLDKGVEFGEAVKEAVKDLVDLMGEGMRGKIEEGFAKDYEGKFKEPPPTDTVGKVGGIDKNSEKGILNRLFNSKNLPKDAKDGLEKEGLKYKVSGQEEAKSIALSVIDELGISEAFALGEAGRFKGGVNGAIMAESINRLAEMEMKASTPKEKMDLALQSAELITRFDEISREKGQDISYINYFYKKSPLGVEMAENARKKKDFDNWAKPKEQSWKEAFEGFLKDPEFQEILKGEVMEGMKSERAKIRAEKKEKVHKSIDETMDKWIKKLTPKSTGGASAKGISVESVFKSVGAAMKKAYDIGEPIAEIVKNAIETISQKLGHKDWGIEEFKKENWEKNLGKDGGYKESDTRHQERIENLQKELLRIRERRRKEPQEKKASTREIPEDEKRLLDEIEAEQTKWDAEKDAARQRDNDYGKLETERNRQLKRVGEINEKIEVLKKGELPETQPKNKKVDTPEIEALKAEKDVLEKSVRESIAHEKKMGELETELQRLKDRKAKEPKPDSKRVISAEERLKRDEIEAERKAWDIENNISKLETELQRVKNRQKKVTDPQQRRELTTAEKDLVKQIKIEKDAWRKEVEPERKVREALKAAEKSLVEYERRIAEKDISKEPTSTTPETPELKALREKRDAKRKEYQAMKKEMTKPSDAEVQAERNRKYLEAFSKKLKGLTAREKEEVVLRSYNKLIERGALDYTEFRDIISEVTGRGKMTDAEAAKLKELVIETNKVDAAAERARTERTQGARALHVLAQVEASKAQKELSTLLYNKPNIGKRLTSLLQLNTLGLASLMRNPVYNIINHVAARLPIGLGQTAIDKAIQLGAKAIGKEVLPETNILSWQVQKEFFKKLGMGSREAVSQFVTGLQRMDYIDKEVQGQQIRPLKSMEDLWDFAQGKKKLTKTQVIDKLIQASPQGWTAEIIARALNLGDKPQRFAAEGAKAAAFAKALGLKDIDYDLFIDFPREEAYMQLKKRGATDKYANEKADYIRDTIKKEGQRSTFQQDNLLNDILNGIPLSQTGIGGLVKATVVSPYIKIPANAYWSYYNIRNPEVAILQSVIYAGKAFAKRNGSVRFAFDKKESTWRHDWNESKYWLAHAATGYAIRAVVTGLVSSGIFRPSNTQDDAKKEREGEQNYEQQGSINLTKLWALMQGEDPNSIKGGYTISSNWGGIIGSMGNSIAQQEENLTDEQRQNREDYWAETFDNMKASGLKEFEQGVFAGASSFGNAMNRGGSVMQSWEVNTLNMFTNIIHPAAFAQMSKNKLPYYTKTKADTFREELENSMLTRSSWLRALTGKYPPSKISIWGDKIEREGNPIQKLFGISKSNDDNFAQPIYIDYKKTNNTDFFPPAVKPEVTVDGERVKLPTKEAAELEELIGQNRKSLIIPFINGGAAYDGYKYTDLKTEKSKVAALKIVYNMGYERGIYEFKEKYDKYKNVREQEDKEAKEETERLNKEFKESLENQVPEKN